MIAAVDVRPVARDPADVVPLRLLLGRQLLDGPWRPPGHDDRFLGARGEGLRGVHSILGSVDGMKRWVRKFDSPVNGFNFCQGTLAEMCVNPAKEVIAS